MAVFHAVFVDEAGDFDVVSTVFGDLSQGLELAGFFMFLPPANRIKSVGGFPRAEARGRDVVEFEETAHALLDVEHHVEVEGLFFEVRKDVGLEHGIIETDVVPADDEIGFEKLIGEGVELVFTVDDVFIGGGGIGDGDRNAELGFVRETPDIADAALSFQVEIDDVFFRHGGEG